VNQKADFLQNESIGITNRFELRIGMLYYALVIEKYLLTVIANFTEFLVPRIPTGVKTTKLRWRHGRQVSVESYLLHLPGKFI